MDQSFEYKELSSGVRSIRDLIISESFNQYSAIVAASKAAYLSVLLQLGVNEIRRYDPAVDLRSVKVGERVSPVILMRNLGWLKLSQVRYWRR